MIKIVAFIILFVAYLLYSVIVYTKGTEKNMVTTWGHQEKIKRGSHLFQQYNCSACHQLFGLGGFLGPELTTAYSDPARGEIYMKTFLKAGGNRMPSFHFNDEEINALIIFLKYVDESAITYKPH
ncbi:MAG: c-type cytochrome [Chitinophagaceae bacterium]